MQIDEGHNFSLKKGEVDVWRADLDNRDFLAEKHFKSLSEDEIKRADRFRFEKDRRRFIVGRCLLRHLLSNYLLINPAEIKFQYSKFGKPTVTETPLKFNLSHSKNTVFFAFTQKQEIGIDVEYVNSNIELEDIAKRFFSRNEYIELLNLTIDDRTRGFYYCWTRKEAFIKAVGEGLSFPLDTFEVSLNPNEPAKMKATHWNANDVKKWSIFPILDESNYIASMVLKGKATKINVRDIIKDGI